MHPLDDCRLKIAGAKQEIDTLNHRIVQFFEANPPTIGIQTDPETGQYEIDFGQVPGFPRRWALSVGHIGLDVRSALNYLVGALVRKSGGQENTSNAFPIGETREDYLRGRGGITHRDRFLKGVAEGFRQRIDSFQPYHRGDLAFCDPLARLAQINNADKHRTLQAAYLLIDLPFISMGLVHHPGTPAMRLGIRFVPSEAGLKTDGKMVITIEADPLPDEAQRAELRKALELSGNPVWLPGAADLTLITRPLGHSLIGLKPEASSHPEMYVDPRKVISFGVGFGAHNQRGLVSLFELREIILRVEEIVESFAADLA